MIASTTAQPEPNITTSDYGMGMIQRYDAEGVDPLNQTIVAGDALSMVQDYDLDEL